ncbi:DNA-binding MarR family transcriptional regulator [Naumannella cuiyingiana]|uniref:DNA-binding MarR family transcriptional regulator n=1 Tax=Naumannella cuiyingiana TaxID=1347891 RepID=A0A7Z0D7Z8_9ACTN|nr:MarR family transcriptional regulator [Naumannella cuiyingiana]NYI70572.1 DNA-binding MarR family transcriptional regulator [Naumannella cuiyingiana]
MLSTSEPDPGDLHGAYRLLIADVYELATLTRRISDAETAPLGLTSAQWHVLSAISEEPRTVAAVARRLGLTRQAVQRVADVLVDAGRAERRPNRDHRTAPLLAITADGRAVLDELWTTTRERRADPLRRAGLSPEDLAQADATLRAVLAALRDGSA